MFEFDVFLVFCYCWGNSSMVEGRFSKWLQSVKKGVLNLFLSISMAYNVISCQKVAENTQIFNIYKNFLSGGFCSKVKIAACQVFATPPNVIFFSRNKGQLQAAVTRPCRLSTPLCHTYSAPSGHEDSPGGTQNLPYLFKNLSI